MYRVSCGLIRLLVRAGLDDRELEIAVLRHQLRVLTRGGKRPRYSTADRAFLAAASRFLPRERWSAFGVVPETLKRWRRQLESRMDPRPRRGPGRPPIDPELRQLILRLGRENPRWGYLRIKGELLKLGIRVSATTIATVLRRGGLGPAPRRIGPTWGEFLRAQALAILSAGSSASDSEDRARRESGPAPAAPDVAEPLPADQAPRPPAPAGRDPTGDQPEPAREEPCDPGLRGPVRIEVAHRCPPGGGRPRDGPTPAHLGVVTLPDHHGRSAGSRGHFAHGRPPGSLPASERRRSSLVGSGSIPACGSSLDAAA